MSLYVIVCKGMRGMRGGALAGMRFPPAAPPPPCPYTLEHQGTPAAATAAAPATRRRHGRTCFGFKGSGHTKIKCKKVLEV